MKPINKLVFFAALAALPFVAFAASNDANKSPLLFTQIAKSVDITACTDKSCDFHLMLKDLKQDETTYFSDRPKHFTGNITVEDFVKNWVAGKDSFKKDHPNASFVYFDTQDNITQNVVELIHPQFDRVHNTLSYDVKEIGKAKLQLGTYQHPVLFIDNQCWSMWGTC